MLGEPGGDCGPMLLRAFGEPLPNCARDLITRVIAIK
jgi:hypothetical protein